MEHLICQICQNNMLLNDERGNKICKEDIPNLKQIQSESKVLWSPIPVYKLLCHGNRAQNSKFDGQKTSVENSFLK